MNFRLCLSLFIIPLVFFAACARKERAVVDLSRNEKIIEVKQDEVSIDDAERKNMITAGQSSQTAPQKMSDNSEITVMYDGYGNKLEKRYFKGHPRVNSVLIRTAADGRREILVYGQNGEKTSVDGELSNRLMKASADEIANAAKIYESRSIYKTRKMPVVEQPRPQPPPTVTLPPVITRQPETTIEEPVEQTPDNTKSPENSPTKPQTEETGKQNNKENK